MILTQYILIDHKIKETIVISNHLGTLMNFTKILNILDNSLWTAKKNLKEWVILWICLKLKFFLSIWNMTIWEDLEPKKRSHLTMLKIFHPLWLRMFSKSMWVSLKDFLTSILTSAYSQTWLSLLFEMKSVLIIL